MKKRVFTLFLAVAVAIACMMPVTVLAAGETLNIDYYNLSFRDNTYIKYAVDADDSNTTVLIWTEPQAEYVQGTEDEALTTVGDQIIGGKRYMVFNYTRLAAKQMTDVVYARAYLNGNYGEVVKYSIIQYAYNKLGRTGTATTDATLITALQDMLQYGASMQTHFNYATDRLATDPFYKITLVGGTFADGFAYGLLRAGSSVEVTAPATNGEGTPFACWKNSAGENVGTTSITVGNKNDVYTAVYENVRTASEGLEYDSNGDGTCYVASIGECEDTEIVIHETSPDGDTVVGISGSAFAGTGIVSVYIPKTVTDIERRAFNNCTSLTDVYFDGTEEEWGEVNVAANNTPLDNATMHFAEAVKYTVTFVDYDGTPLKTEQVEQGKNATPPEAPTRDGYVFDSWDGTYTNVTSDQTVTAVYEDETSRNVIDMSYIDNGNGTFTVTVAVKGAIVNLSGLEGYVSFDSDAITYSSSSKLSHLSGAVNYDSSDGKVYFSLADSSDMTVEEQLLNITFAYTSSVDTTVQITITDIYNQSLQSETYSVRGGHITIGA